MAIGANSSLVVEGKRGMADDWALDTLVKASKPNKKITTASRLICVHSFPYKMSLVRYTVCFSVLSCVQFVSTVTY
jgi:hypothetical protein